MAGAEITRAECWERARLLRVRSYDVTLDLTREESFGSVCVAQFDCTEPGAASHADLVARAAHEIRLNGTWLEPAATWSGGRIALPALAARNELRAVADCSYSGSGTGMHRSAGSDDGGTYVYGKHPVASDAATLSEAIANFDMISYAKGASVLRQLSGYVGEQEFFSGLRGYLVRHAYGNARLADLIDAVAASSGRDLAAWSRAWLQTAGPSTLRGRFRTDADGAFTEFAILQEGTFMRPHRVSVGLYLRSDGTLARSYGLTVDVAGARTEVPELVGARQPDLILLNDDDAGYVLVRFDPRSLRTVLESVGELPGDAGRGGPRVHPARARRPAGRLRRAVSGRDRGHLGAQRRSSAGAARHAAVPLPGGRAGTAGADRGVPDRRAP